MGCQVEDLGHNNGKWNEKWKYPNTSNKQTNTEYNGKNFQVNLFFRALFCSLAFCFVWVHLNWQQYYYHEVMRLFYKCVALTFYLIRQIGIWHSMFTTLCYYNSTSMNQTVSVCAFSHYSTSSQDEVDISRFSNTFASDHFLLLCNFAM